MLPKDKDLVLKEKVKLYNNVAKINNCEGRLLAELSVYPKPSIVWEFEILGEHQCNFPYSAPWTPDLLNSLVGYLFRIEKPKCNSSLSDIGPLSSLRGSAAQAVYGDMESTAHKFVFYLPNTRFQSIGRQDRLIQTLRRAESGIEVGQSEAGRSVGLSLDNTWSIDLSIQHDALAWLDSNKQKIGALITTVGRLYQPKYKATEPETFLGLQSITLSHALERLENLSRFLSYANGGYIGPLYIEGCEYTQDRKQPVRTSCATALAFHTTSLDRLGASWLTTASDLKGYMECFPTFECMMQNSVWQEIFEFVLAKYFQATQPTITWQDVASAAGAALERLSYIILLEEKIDANQRADHELLFKAEKDKQESKRYEKRWRRPEYKKKDGKYLSQAGIRLSVLLEQIGLVADRDSDNIQAFLDVRNEATHPKASSVPVEQRWKLINQAIQWVDEILLWRVGYGGKYLDRLDNLGYSTKPRCDLSLRNLTW